MLNFFCMACTLQKSCIYMAPNTPWKPSIVLCQEIENIICGLGCWGGRGAIPRSRGRGHPKSPSSTVRCCSKSVALQKRMSAYNWQQGWRHIVLLYIVMHASYRGLSYKSALDGWSSCTTCVRLRLSRLLKSCGIRKQYYRSSYCCSLFVRHSATLVKWLGHVTLRYQWTQTPASRRRTLRTPPHNCPDSAVKVFFLFLPDANYPGSPSAPRHSISEAWCYGCS